MSAAARLPLLSALALAAGLFAPTGQAAAACRTISMYHVHTHERVTATYWCNGRFRYAGLRKLNRFLRDWRRNRVVRIDPRTIDLIWKLHRDLRSRAVIHIVSGHRSARTNAMLRRIGRNVARRSRHITGQAIDFKFPDVSSVRVRNLALAYGIGGVGYYGRKGFIHVDTGSVRHWPRMSQRKLAWIKRKYTPLIGRGWRGYRGGTLIAFNTRGAARNGNWKNGRKPAPAAARATNSRPVILANVPKGKARAAYAGLTPRPRPDLTTPRGAVPVPRSRPYEVLVQAASAMEIIPAAASPAVTNFARSRKAPGKDLGLIIANLNKKAPARAWPKVNRTGKTDLATAIRTGKARGVPLITTAVNGRLAVNRKGKGDAWLARLGATPEQVMRRNGAPAPMAAPGEPLITDPTHPQMAAALEKADKAGKTAAPAAAPRVNRAAKGDLLLAGPQPLRKAALPRR
ncbi:MAG TPA: DUF882 domain-containing protein [Thermopetrobacter sp.]|nr:DUF882 domain-containing protein [Thermopetrobacter sp.]